MSFSPRMSPRMSGVQSGGFAGGGGTPAVLPPDANGVVWWAAEDFTPTSWLDRWRGNVNLTGPSSGERPTLAADGVNFNGDPVVTYDGTDDVTNNVAISPSLITAGARPHYALICRHRNAASGQNDFFTPTDNPLTAGNPYTYRTAAGAVACIWGDQTTTGGVVGTGVHLVELFINGAGKTVIGIDGVDTVNGGGSTITSIEIGQLWLGEASVGNNSQLCVSDVFAWSAALSAGDRSLLLAYAQTRGV